MLMFGILRYEILSDMITSNYFYLKANNWYIGR